MATSFFGSLLSAWRRQLPRRASGRCTGKPVTLSGRAMSSATFKVRGHRLISRSEATHSCPAFKKTLANFCRFTTSDCLYGLLQSKLLYISHCCDAGKHMRHRRSGPWKRATPCVHPHGLPPVRWPLERFEPVLPRLYTCLTPLVTSCQGQGAAQHATISVCGLWSHLARQNGAAMASRLGPLACPGKRVGAGRSRPMRPGARPGAVKARGPWAKAMVRGGAPSGWAKAGHASGGGPGRRVVVGARRSGTGPWTWETAPARAPPWWTSGVCCLTKGRRPKPAWPKPGGPQPPAPSARGTRGPGRCGPHTGPGGPERAGWGQRAGTSLWVAASAGRGGGAVPGGGPVAPGAACPGHRAPGVERPGTPRPVALAQRRARASGAEGSRLAAARRARWPPQVLGGGSRAATGRRQHPSASARCGGDVGGERRPGPRPAHGGAG